MPAFIFRESLPGMEHTVEDKLSRIVNIYVLILLTAFPLIIVHSYFDIQDVKMYLYLYSTIACTVLVLLARVYYFFKGRKDRAAAEAAGERRGPSAFLHSFHMADIFAAVFFGVILVSTFGSEWVYEAFWGNTARYQGGFLWMWYVVTYFLVSRHYRPSRWHMDAFLACGLIVCGWGVLDYFSLSPIGVPYQTSFSSTFGNTNVLTAAEAMYLAAAAVMLIGTDRTDGTDKMDSTDRTGRKGNLRSLFYFLASLVVFMGLECGHTANSLISAGFLVCFLPFYAFGSRQRAGRYVLFLIACVLAMLTVGVLTAAFPGYAATPDYQGELGRMANTHLKELAALLVLLAVIYAGIRFLARRSELRSADAAEDDRRFARRMRVIWAVLGVFAFCGVLFILYDANIRGNAGRYGALQNFVVLDERWGTYRGYAWALAMKYFSGFTPLKKLVGSGPETFSIYVLIHDLNANLRRFDLNYDSIHNEWLQHLFEEGLIGFISYYGMNICCILEGFGFHCHKKKAVNRTLGAAYSFIVLTYLMQSFVNISVPLILPLAMVFMSAAAASGRIEEQRTKEN